MRRWSEPRRRRSVALTPLIDVVFLLLIFFVMAGRFAEETRLVLKAEAAADAPPLSASETPPMMLVNVALDGTLSLAGRDVLPDQLALAMPADASVVLRLHPDLPLDTMVSVIDGLRANGVTRLSYLAPSVE